MKSPATALTSLRSPAVKATAVGSAPTVWTGSFVNGAECRVGEVLGKKTPRIATATARARASASQASRRRRRGEESNPFTPRTLRAGARGARGSAHRIRRDRRRVARDPLVDEPPRAPAGADLLQHHDEVVRL